MQQAQQAFLLAQQQLRNREDEIAQIEADASRTFDDSSSYTQTKSKQVQKSNNQNNNINKSVSHSEVQKSQSATRRVPEPPPKKVMKI